MSTTEFQREVMSRHKMKHSLLQETPINNMTSNEETNYIMTSNEEAKENNVNSALHQDLDSWLKRELLPINDTFQHAWRRKTS